MKQVLITTKYSDVDVIKMLGYQIDNALVEIDGRIFPNTTDIPKDNMDKITFLVFTVAVQISGCYVGESLKM